MFSLHTHTTWQNKTRLLQTANIIYNNWQYLPIVLALEALEKKGVNLSTHHHCATSFMAPFTKFNIKTTDTVVYGKLVMNKS